MSAFYPNVACFYFCYWMLNVSKQHLSGPQKTIVQSVMDAAAAGTTIPAQEWYNFNLFTAWRNPYYIVYRDYATETFPTLYTDLVGAWSFEGTTNAAYGGFTDPSMNTSTSLGAGKILQGANFIDHTNYVGMSPQPYSGTVFTMNIWVYVRSVPDFKAIWIDNVFNFGLFVNYPSGAIGYGGTSQIDANTALPLNEWVMVTVTGDASGMHVYYNTVDVSVSNPPVSSSYLFNFSTGNINYFFDGYMDAAALWHRVLTPAELLILYNDGVGRQFPY